MKSTINGSAKDFLALIGNGNQTAEVIADAVAKKLEGQIPPAIIELHDSSAEHHQVRQVNNGTCHAADMLDQLWYHTNSGGLEFQMSIPHIMRTSWKHIRDCIVTNNIDWLLSGTVIPIPLKNGKTLDVEVARDEDGKVYFIFRDCWPERHCMSEEESKDGWADSDLRAYANDEDDGIISLFPDELKSLICRTKIQYKMNGKLITCKDKLFCLSMTQVFGKGKWTENEPVDTWLDIFQNGDRSRVKNLDGSAVWWWLRSANYDYYFYYVYASGNGNYNYANNAGGVALGFCLEA